MTKKKQQQHQTRRTLKEHDTAAPVIEHLYELRKRVMYCAASIVVVGTGAYFVQQHIVNALLQPAHGQQFIYTSPGGGISFLFKLCLYIGIAVSIPLITYQVLRYLQPLIKAESTRFLIICSFVCAMLAFAGMCFGYYVGLPAALHFLLHQFSTKQIHALLSIQEYMSFVTAYMMGSALLFQIPLVLLFINRIRPLRPKKLLHYERWVVLIAFITSGLMNPTPNIISQLAVAGPIVLMYQIGIILVAWANWRRKPLQSRQALFQQDSEAREARLKRAVKLSAPKHATPVMAAAIAPIASITQPLSRPKSVPTAPVLVDQFISAPSRPVKRPAQRPNGYRSSRQKYAMDILPTNLQRATH